MSFLKMNKATYKITDVWIDDARVYARAEDGSIASYAFEKWPRLKNSTKEQLADYKLSYYGIHWPQLDEDLSFTGMFIDSGLCAISSPEETYYYNKL